MYYKTFVPKWTKPQFIAWASKKYGNKTKFTNMKKNQLIAIYLNSK